MTLPCNCWSAARAAHCNPDQRYRTLNNARAVETTSKDESELTQEELVPGAAPAAWVAASDTSDSDAAMEIFMADWGNKRIDDGTVTLDRNQKARQNETKQQQRRNRADSIAGRWAIDYCTGYRTRYAASRTYLCLSCHVPRVLRRRLQRGQSRNRGIYSYYAGRGASCIQNNRRTETESDRAAHGAPLGRAPYRAWQVLYQNDPRAANMRHGEEDMAVQSLVPS